jgi:NAD(P)-dependent dehydrogenase (short-subunit alcohol dehydrogenase family)
VNISTLFSVEGYGVVVTGGASGLGLAFAEALATNGARVTMLDIDSQRLAFETERLRAGGGDVRGAVVDVSDHAVLDDAIAAAAALYGRLDVVFANAGIDSGPGFIGGWVGPERPRNPAGALEHYTDARWNKVIEVNLTGVFATLRAAARHMRPRKSGRLIVTTSLAALKCEAVVGAAYMAA